MITNEMKSEIKETLECTVVWRYCQPVERNGTNILFPLHAPIVCYG